MDEAIGRMAVFEVTDATFDEQVASAEGVTVVDFWAPWCGPCHAMAPHFEAVAGQLEPKFRFAKVDTDASPDLAGRYQIRQHPDADRLPGRQAGRAAGRRHGRGIAGPLARVSRRYFSECSPMILSTYFS